MCALCLATIILLAGCSRAVDYLTTWLGSHADVVVMLLFHSVVSIHGTCAHTHVGPHGHCDELLNS